MDPNLFHIDWERTIEALAGIIILSFLIERACALLFESRWWIVKFEDPRVSTFPAQQNSGARPKLLTAHKYPLKETIGFILALVVCYFWSFDAISIILLSEKTGIPGIIITAFVIAGGSKASIKLFHDILNIRSNANAERKILRDQDKNS